MSKIQSASILYKIKGMVEEDIENLKLQLGDDLDRDLYDFVKSLVHAKTKIIERANTHESVEHIPNPPERHKIHYRDFDMSSREHTDILNDILRAEEDQMDYIKKASRAGGYNEDVTRELDRILDIYSAIVDKLHYSKSTQQLGTIVL